MESIVNPKYLDIILKYLVEKGEERFTVVEIQEDLFPALDYSTVHEFCDYIIKYPEKIIQYEIHRDWNNIAWLQSNTFTTIFLKKGGFEKVVENELKSRKEAASEKALNQQLVLSTIKTNKWARIGVIVSLVISLASLIVAIFKE